MNDDSFIARFTGIASGGEIDFLPRLIKGDLPPLFEAAAALTPKRLGTIAARSRAKLNRVSGLASHCENAIEELPEDLTDSP